MRPEDKQIFLEKFKTPIVFSHKAENEPLAALGGSQSFLKSSVYAQVGIKIKNEMPPVKPMVRNDFVRPKLP